MTFDFTIVFQHLPFLLGGVWLTLELSVLGMVLGFTVGIVGASMRVYGGSVLSSIAALYVDCIRSVPLISIMVWAYFALPIAINRTLSPFASSIISLSIYSGAYFSEIIRAGLGSIPKGQEQAALALGMTPVQALRRIIFPQALMLMLPAIGSQLIILIKDSSICSGIGMAELMFKSQLLGEQIFRRFEIFTVVAGIYFLITYPVAIAVNLVFRTRSIREPS